MKTCDTSSVFTRSKGTILVVDDDPNDRMLIETAFLAAGATLAVKVLANGIDAIAYLKGEGDFRDRSRYPYPSFLLTDLKMVPIDGLDLLHFLRGTPRSAIIPTVVFSSSGHPDDVDKAYALGASSYHVKSSSAEGFLAQLKLLHDYWMSCQVPEVDDFGVRKVTDSRGLLGERFSSSPFSPGPSS